MSMKLGYAYKANGGEAVGQAVKELLEGKVKRIRFAIATQPKRGGPVLHELHTIGIGHVGKDKAVRWCGEGGDPNAGHGLTLYGPEEFDPYEVVGKLCDALDHCARSFPNAEVFRPLEDCDAEVPWFGVFEV
jgi:hypothetical protein